MGNDWECGAGVSEVGGAESSGHWSGHLNHLTGAVSSLRRKALKISGQSPKVSFDQREREIYISIFSDLFNSHTEYQTRHKNIKVHI